MTAAEHLHTAQKLTDVAALIPELLGKELNSNEMLLMLAIRQILIGVAETETSLALHAAGVEANA